MSYKTELQSNNTDIQTIEKYIDEFGSLIAGQDNLIAQIQTAIEGKAIVSSGEPSINDIGVFTVDGINNVKFLFIKGMTFGEFCSSKMNKTFYDEWNDLNIITNYKTSLDIGTDIADSGIAASYGSISEDGLIPCDENVLIKEMKYQLCEIFV